MKPYVIRQGDYLAKLAHLNGFDADTVWNDPKNEELKEQRSDPSQLQAGDILFVPDEPKKRMKLTKETENKYVAKVPTIKVELNLAEDGEPIADEPYVVEGLGDDEERKTDADGLVSFEAPMHVREVLVKLTERDMQFRVGVGELDPVETPSGQRSRLTQLGFYLAQKQGADGYESRNDDQLAAAMKAFQRSQGLEATGELDDATKAALVDAHGS